MHRLKGQDVPSGGRLAGEQPGRSRGAVLSRSGRSTEITRRPLPPLGADSFARATSRQSTSKLSMIDGVEPAMNVRAQLRRVITAIHVFDWPVGIANARPVENLSRYRSMVSTLLFSSIANMSSWSVLLLVRTSWKSVAASLASSRF